MFARPTVHPMPVLRTTPGADDARVARARHTNIFPPAAPLVPPTAPVVLLHVVLDCQTHQTETWYIVPTQRPLVSEDILVPRTGESGEREGPGMGIEPTFTSSPPTQRLGREHLGTTFTDLVSQLLTDVVALEEQSGFGTNHNVYIKRNKHPWLHDFLWLLEHLGYRQAARGGMVFLPPKNVVGVMAIVTDDGFLTDDAQKVRPSADH